MLYISAFPPNHRSGGQTYSYNALIDLKKHYNIDLIYFEYSDQDYEKIEGIRLISKFKPSIWRCFQLPILYPRLTNRFSYNILDYLKRISGRYDCIYFDYIQVATYSLFIDHPLKIVRCHDILGQKYTREKSKVLPWIKESEKIILKSVSRIFVPSKKDVVAVKKLYGLKSTYTNEYLTPYRIHSDVNYKNGYIFFGVWSRYENINGLRWFINNVFLKYRDCLKENFVVMGGGLSDEDYRELLEPYNIQYLGYVEDSYSEIVKYKAMIVPLFEGAGIKVKVLDSFTTGTPVIGTDVAFEGIKDLNGLTYRANTPAEFIKVMNSLPENSGDEKQRKQTLFFNYYNKRHLSDFL